MATKQFHKFYFKATDMADNTKTAVLSLNQYSCTQPVINRTNNKRARDTRQDAMSYDDPGTFAEEGEFACNDDTETEWLKTARQLNVELTDDEDQVEDTGAHESRMRNSVLKGVFFVDSVTESNDEGIKRLTVAYSVNGPTSVGTAS